MLFFHAYFFLWVVVTIAVLTIGVDWKPRALIAAFLTLVAVTLLLNGHLLIAVFIPLLLLAGPRWKRRIAYGLPVWALFALYPTFWFGMEEYYRYLARRDYAHFQELCMQAEETIYRRTENVEGVLRMKVYRPYFPTTDRARRHGSLADQFGLENPYGQMLLEPRFGPDVFVHAAELSQYPPTYKYLEEVIEVDAPAKPPFRRYWSVETDELIGSKFPGSSRAKEKFRRIESAVVLERKAKYGYTWRDLTTNELRERWIAGAEYRVVDLDTGEVLGKKVGYIFARQYPGGHLDQSTWGRGLQQRCKGDNRLIFQFIADVLVPVSRNRGNP